MRKKLILFLMLALLGSTSFLRADETTYGFEDGMPVGWTVIDSNNDGWTWTLTSDIPTTWTYYASMSLDWYRSGTNAICSGSYINGVGALTPDEYLVTTPLTLVDGSNFSFWAAATDASYPADHFGVFISDNGTSGWTMLNEWTLTAKSGGNNGGRASRDGNGAKLGTWYQYSVDLSAYAGQQKYVALRHFNCNDQYIMCVDDIIISEDGGPLPPEPPTPVGNELTVYDGTATSNKLPMYVYYFDDWTRSQYIIPAFDLQTISGTAITALKYYTTNSNVPYTTVSSLKFYLTEVDYTTLTEYVSIDDAQVVYEGTVDFTAEQEAIITFDTPYLYNGGNLLIGCENTSDAGYKNIYFYGQSAQGAGLYGSNGNDPASIPAYAENFIPKTTLTFDGDPIIPTGELTVVPETFELGERPLNAWMEPFNFKIINGGPDTHIQASVSGNAFVITPEINMDFAHNATLDGVLGLNSAAAAGDYNETFSLFYVEDQRSVIEVPVTANAYTAVAPDVVELPGTITPASFTLQPTGMHANYLLQGMTEMMTDAVYTFSIDADCLFDATFDASHTGIIALYEYAEDFLPTTNAEPYWMGENSLTGVPMIAGQYYMIVASENLNGATITGYTSALPAPTEITYIAPENMLHGVTAPLSLVWEGGQYATQYQVLFGTTYPPTHVALDWTLVDENYGTFEIAELNNTTQYFWQIKAKNSEGEVSGPIWGFTSAVDVPTGVKLTEDMIFTDGSTTVKWKNMGTGGGYTGEFTVCDGTATSSYIPVYGLWMDDYTRAEMIYPAEMLEEMNGGEITSLKYYISSAATGPWSGDVFNVYMMEVDATTLSSYYTSTNAQIVYTGGLDGQGSEMVIELDEPYTYGGGNLLVGFEETVCGTYKSCSFYGIDATGASASGYNANSLAAVSFTQRDFLPKTTFTCGGKGYRDPNISRSLRGYNVYMVYGEQGGSNPPTPPTPPSGDSWSDDFEDGNLTNWTTIDADGDGQTWVNATPASYDIGNAHSGTNCASSWSWNSVSYDPDNYMVSPMFANAGSIQYFVATNTGYPDHYALMASTTGTSTSDFTIVFEETVGSAKDGYHGTKSSTTKAGTRAMSDWFERNITLPAGTKYVAFRHYNSYDNNYLFVDDVTISSGSKDGEITSIKLNDELLTVNQFDFEADPTFYNMPDGGNIHVTAVFDEGESDFDHGVNTLWISGYSSFGGTVTELISGEPIADATVNFVGKDEFNNSVTYSATTNATGQYVVEGVKVGALYSGTAAADDYEAQTKEGLATSHLETTTVDFVLHEVYYPVYKVYAEDVDGQMAKVQWSMSDFTTPGGTGPTPPTPPTGGWTEDFESGMPTGWATIDADGDGDTWMLGSTAMGTGYGHNSSSDLILSKSYDNNTGVLYPDNYLVTSQVTPSAGSTFSFYACAQDASYAAEHFGVAVSTGSQTTSSDFTMVQEWTMTAKSSGIMAPGRDGQTRAQGNWYQYNVDLSSYAGQAIYIAIRHFNCSDMFYLDVDDVAFTTGSKGDRSVNYYVLYKQALFSQNNPSGTEPEILLEQTTDTLYADFAWFNDEPGLYQYGVSAVYPIPEEGKGNRGGALINFETGDFSQYNFNNTSSYPWTVTAPSSGNSSSFCMKSTNGGVASSAGTISATATYPTEGTVSFIAECMGEGTSTIWDKCIFAIDGTEMFCYGANVSGWHEYSYDVESGDHTFTWTYSKDGSVNPTGDYFMVDDIEFSYTGGGGGNNPITDITWSNVLPKDMENQVTVNATINYGSVEGAVVKLINQNEENYVYQATFDETGEIVFEDFRKGNYTIQATLAGYTSQYANATPVSLWDDNHTITINFTEDYQPVPTMIVSSTGYARWTDILPHDTDIAERYIVTMNDVLQGETTDCYMQLDVANLVDGQTYPAKVAVIYSTGMSPWTTTTFVYHACDGTTPVIDEVVGDQNTMDVTITWNGGTPPTPPTPPTGDVYDFEDGTLQGWTALDADGDGYNWAASTQFGGHNGSSGVAYSQSYDNNYGVLYPDNYLVSPAKAEYPGITFYACAQDASYAAEHFGVAVSTTTATASAFTMVQEWTLSAKGGQPTNVTRSGSRTQGSWYEYSVDLSSYAGQEIWVAIRHFNCSDMFYIDIDDITLGDGGSTPPTPPTPPTGDVYDFEDGTLQGWTALDADGDGYNWAASTQFGGHNGSSGVAYSQSYDNNYGVLYPDNYLVSPAKAEYPSISFYACAQDASYAAEHFGVAVSTTTATASAFTMVQEWTLSAKGNGQSTGVTRSGNRTQGNWYEYTVDLSAYAGQEIWVAIRHFNCSDMFYIDVDDISLGDGGSTPPTPPTPPTGNTFDFEDGTLQGWTALDADGDGYNWAASTQFGGHSGSTGIVYSQSYDNNYGVLYPDNYLVSPSKAAYTGISFWACAQDASYAAEHFGVAVSTTTATASAFTMVQEWTLSAKGNGQPTSVTRSGNRTQGTWYQYTVDLSAYAGQEIWVAIRHFNCSDMFYIDVDDITLGDEKRNGSFAAAGKGYGPAANFVDDGNWYFYDNGTNSDAIGLTSGGGFYWGIMLPAGTYEGTTLSKIAYFDYSAHSGQIMIYQGGTSAPTTMLYSQNYTVSGTEQYIEIEMEEPVQLDEAENVWVVMHNTNGQYVASIDASSGVNYGSCISTDGSTWYTTVSSATGGQLDGNWNLRAYIETGGGSGAGASAIVPNKYNILVDGEVVGATSGNYFTWTCPDFDEHLYEVVWVDADYNITCPEGVWYRIPLTQVSEFDVVNNIYPNPTSGELHIEAAGMTRISVINTLGQVVLDQAVKSDETVINMAKFDNGIYMVRIATQNGTSVKRVVVSK